MVFQRRWFLRCTLRLSAHESWLRGTHENHTLDIDQQQFQRVFRGVDPDEVRTFLSQVSRQLEDVVRENQRLDEQVRRQEKQLEEFRAHDAQLRGLASAGRMTEDIRERPEGGRIDSTEASLEAEKIVVDSRSELAQLSEYPLVAAENPIDLGLKTVLESHRRLLEAQEELDRQSISQRKNGQARARR